MRLWALIPVKSLHRSKSRLAPLLSAKERAALTGSLLTRTLEAIRETPAIAQALVISPDPTVLELAQRFGAQVVDEGAPLGLNEAVTRGTEVATRQGAEGVLVLPADLPFISPDDLAQLLEAAASVPPMNLTVICPDRADAGTNALFLAPPLPFAFHYGPDSFRRHSVEGRDRGRTVMPLRVPGLQFDLDTKKDWLTYQVIQRQLDRAAPGRLEVEWHQATD